MCNNAPEMHTFPNDSADIQDFPVKVCAESGILHTFRKDLLALHRILLTMARARQHKDDLEIVYEDQWLVVVNKPSGLLTIATGGAAGSQRSGGAGKTNGFCREDTAYSRLYDHFGKIFIVHRLDRDTSGLLVFAKDQDTKFALQENWDEAVLERKYVAILEGEIKDEEGWIETWLYENPKSMKVHCYELSEREQVRRAEMLSHGSEPASKGPEPPREDWHFASSHCRKLKEVSINGAHYTMVEFSLETGRKNQIRVHSEWIGHPIAGDRKYNARTNPLGRLALHAQTLSFLHPRTGKLLKFTSRLPKSFRLL